VTFAGEPSSARHAGRSGMLSAMFAELPELEAGLDKIRRSPHDEGTLALIVRRPAPSEREVLGEGTLDASLGLVGDRWSASPADPRTMLTLMNARSVAAVARSRDRWALAGDQLFVDLNLGYANLPPGTRLAVGAAVIEVTEVPHRGCGKFIRRFGLDASKFVNSPVGRELNLRGINARVLTGGMVRAGDQISKLSG
jgi:MOSC domain-containing protein YiiM